MEYEIFERDFIVRTLKILNQYETLVMGKVAESEQFEVTLLINCLLGLLVLPKERCYVSIPELSLDQLTEWGLAPEFIQSWGNHPHNLKPEQYCTLLEIVQRLRNGVAHTHVKPLGNGNEITKLEFTDRNGFRAVVPVQNLKIFVTKLAQSVKPL
ncbi:MAG: HEPN family nuclease [Chloroflexota bacterium]